MKIELSDGNEIYCKVGNISSVSINKLHISAGDNEYDVMVSFINQMPLCLYRTKNEEIAKEAMIKIGKLIEEDSNEKTYLDGFKDGTEYALKLMEKGR